MTDVSEVRTASIIRTLMMEALSTSETSVILYETTRRNIPEDSHIHTRRRENLKSYFACNLISKGSASLVFLFSEYPVWISAWKLIVRFSIVSS
jgi:hypothetical protein